MTLLDLPSEEPLRKAAMSNLAVDIAKAINSVGKNQWSNEYTDLEVALSDDGKGSFRIRLSAMYEHVNVNVDVLGAIAGVIGTDHINIGDDRDFYSGCDSCDYGSSYWVDLTAWL